METTQKEQKGLEKIKKIIESKTSLKVIEIIGVFIVVMIIFQAGIAVGIHKASFGRAWGDHYNENFGFGRRGGDVMSFFPNPHGATGKIIKIESSNLIVEDRDNTEKSISIATDTKIQKGQDTILLTDLKVDDFIVVIGAPNTQGVIEAKLVRVIPSPQFLNKINTKEKHA